MIKKIYNDVEIIYIDPPYNTGNDDNFCYKDGYQSSSWLSMVIDRIKLGYELLSNNGIMFITIGDEEYEHLSVALRELFGKLNCFATLIWEKKKKGSFLSGKIANMKDYILCISKDSITFNGLIGEIATEVETYPCVNASNPRDIRKIEYPIKSKYKESNYSLPANTVISAGNMHITLKSDLNIKERVLVPPLVVEGQWRYSQESFEEYAKKEEIYITQDLYLRRIVKEPRYKRMKDLLLRVGDEEESNYKEIEINNLYKYGWGSNEDANDELKKLSNASSSKRNLKALVLLDPFGMQLNWESIASLKNCGADVWILVPTGTIINRLLDGKGKLLFSDKLQKFFGLSEEEIRSFFYENKIEATLFGEELICNKLPNTVHRIAELYVKRLKEIFEYVTEKPLVLNNTRGVPIFHFVFASNNATALNIANDIVGNKRGKK